MGAPVVRSPKFITNAAKVDLSEADEGASIVTVIAIPRLLLLEEARK